MHFVPDHTSCECEIGMNNSSLAPQIPHFGSSHFSFEWQEGRQVWYCDVKLVMSSAPLLWHSFTEMVGVKE